MNPVTLPLLAAFLLDILLGDPRGYPHPVKLIGKLIEVLDHLFYRATHSPLLQKLAGGLLVFLVVGISYGAAFLLLYGATKIDPLLAGVLSALLIYTTIAARDLSRHAAAIYDGLMGGSLEKARERLGHIVGRDTASLDESEIVRATVETVAENTTDGVTAPLFFAALGGAPLALAYRAVNTLDSMIGHKDDKYLHFGWAAARLDDLANYLPARITALVLLVTAFLISPNGKNTLTILLRDGRKHPSPNAGLMEAGFAGVLGVRLGGENWYNGEKVLYPFLGEPLVPLHPVHIRKGVSLMWVVSVLFLVLSLIILEWKIFVGFIGTYII